MRGRKTRLGLGLLLVALLLALLIPVGASGGGEGQTTTVLFTHDLHSSFLPHQTAEGEELAGYARLATALERQRSLHPDALTVDGGDFSIGSLIQTLYTSYGPELRTLGALGYDATTFGNHEFDHQGTGLAQMLTAARNSGDPLPAIVASNYQPAQDNPDRLDIQRAMSAYGVKETIVLERGGVTYGLFGLMGMDADDCAPSSGFTLSDPIETAKACVDSLKNQGAEFIICLSHSGTAGGEGKSEDGRLAKEVPEIDLIVSGHSHTVLEQPIVVGDTYIVSAGSNGEYLGSITVSRDGDGGNSLVDYQLIPIDSSLAEDPEIAALVDGWKDLVGSRYLSAFGLTYDQVLTSTSFDLIRPENMDGVDNGLGNLVADAYHWAASNLAREETDADTVTVVANGVLRASLYRGSITVADAYDVLSMGVGADGRSGFPLVSCYLTGKELKAVMEVDASVSPIMAGTQLYFSGASYRSNGHRVIFNRVTDAVMKQPAYAAQFGEQFTYPLENDKLYRVVSGMYSAQMLGTVKDKSFGILSIEPKDENGQPITDFTTRILRDEAGGEIKEWYALAAYLENFGGKGVPTHYTEGSCKEISHSWNPIELVKQPGLPTIVLIVLLAVLIAAVVLVVRRATGMGGRRRQGGGYRRRRRFL